MTTGLSESKKALENVKELIEGNVQELPPMDTTPRIELLELSLEELRIIYARLDDSMATTRVRALTFLGAGLALLSYLYGGGDLFIPHERYGRVFYFLGLGFMAASISFLLYALRPTEWAVPMETKLTKLNRHKTKENLLEVIVEEYIESMMANIGRYEKKAQLYSSGFFLLLCGGILLLVIKNIGG